MRVSAAIPILLLFLTGCEREREELEPYPQVLVVVDTDVDVGSLADALQIDVYLPRALDGGPLWIANYRILRNQPETWPVSFSLQRDDFAGATEVWLRLRLFPDGKLRDHRGERFFEDETLARYPGADEPGPDVAACPTFLDADRVSATSVVRTVDSAGAVGPEAEGTRVLDEPQPGVTIDRLVRLELGRGDFGRVSVVLRGACFGVQADLFDGESCVDGAERRVRVPLESVESGNVEPPSAPSTLVGAFPEPAPCLVEPRAGRPGMFDEEVCIDREAFVLGDPAVFGYGDFDAFPERIAVAGPMAFDRYEVTVGRFREAWDAGFLPDAVPPITHDGPLAETEVRESSCTFTSAPIDPERERRPLNCVTFATARAFCRSLGGDLPTEAQWELVAAAAGRDGQDSYPWGPDAPTCERAVHGRGTRGAEAGECPGQAGPAPLDAATGDVTPVHGVAHLGGNLREWTLDAYRAYCSACWLLSAPFEPRCDVRGATVRTVRGGDWLDASDFLLSAIRNEGLREDEWDPRVGFRCVRADSGAQPTVEPTPEEMP